MAGKTAVLALKITGDASDAKRAVDDADGKLDGFGKKIGGLGLAVTAGVGVAAGGLAMFGKAAFDAASNAEQALGGINSVFGDWALDIEQAADGAATSVGLSKTSYEELAAVIGSQLKGAGFHLGDMNDKTQELIKTGADLAATFGGTTADAVDALSSVMKGEFDPIERYGVSLKQSDLNARLAALGQDKLTGAALKTATANAALGLITEQTASSTGQFALQGDSAAEKSQKLAAWWENLKAKAGEGLLPIFGMLVDFFTTKLGPWFDKLTEQGGPLADALAKVGSFVKDQLIPAVTDLWNFLAPKLLPILKDVGAIIRDVVVPAFSKIWDYVKTYVVPILKSVLGPALEGLQTAWGKLRDALEENKGKFQEIYDKVKPFLEFVRDKVAPFVGGALKLAFEGLGKAIGPVVDTITWLLSKSASVLGFLGTVGKVLFGKPAAATAGTGGTRNMNTPLFGAARGGLFGASSSLGGGVGPTAAGGLTTVPVGDTYNITVTGALDPVAVADQIDRLLSRRATRTGSRVAVAFG